MKKLKRSKGSWNSRIELFIIGVILFGLIFFMIISPAAVAYGVVTGQIDIETLEPVEVDNYGNRNTKKSIY